MCIFYIVSGKSSPGITIAADERLVGDKYEL